MQPSNQLYIIIQVLLKSSSIYIIDEYVSTSVAAVAPAEPPSTWPPRPATTAPTPVAAAAPFPPPPAAPCAHPLAPLAHALVVTPLLRQSQHIISSTYMDKHIHTCIMCLLNHHCRGQGRTLPGASGGPASGTAPSSSAPARSLCTPSAACSCCRSAGTAPARPGPSELAG